MEMTMWQDQSQLDEIRKIYAPTLNELEFKTFVVIGKTTGLNPFLREIWAIKYGDKSAANIFVGRDGYRKTAQQNSEYDYHQVDAVYSNDVYRVKAGEIEHEYNLKERGKLIGAYCVTKRKNATKGIYVFVQFSEYYQGCKDEKGNVISKPAKGGGFYKAKPTLWDTKPATMICKVAEAQSLRMAFQEIFAGTYDESENWNKDSQTTVSEGAATGDFNKVKAVVDAFKDRSEYAAQKEEIMKMINSLPTPDLKNEAKTYVLDKFKSLPEKTQAEVAKEVFDGEVVDPTTGEIIEPKPAKAKKAAKAVKEETPSETIEEGEIIK